MKLAPILSCLALCLPALAQTGIPPSDWPMYAHDLTGSRYSPLDRINAGNVANLRRAWTYGLRTEAERTGPGSNSAYSQVTPIVVHGVMYLTAGKRVVALEPETGKELWVYEADSNVATRGVAYWSGQENIPPRLITSAGRTLFALNPESGKLDPGFGKEGKVDIVVPYNSPPTIYKNLVILGANVPERQGPNAPPGNTRAYDARTGAKVWEFRSIPRPGEKGSETWRGDDWVNRTGVNNWGFYMTIDEQRGILYNTFGSPASDFYAGDRPGDNLYANSLVALDAATGKYLWHFQAVHHDQWDMDLPPPPTLLDVRINGELTPILAQGGKTGFVYILNRVTGEPIFGIKETPVPKSKVPGEESSPTQPIPVKPPPIARVSFDMSDLVTAEDTNEAHAKACQDLVERSGGIYNEGPFTPWTYRTPDAPTASSVNFPGPIAGNDWGGLSVDPDLGYFFINSSDYASLGWIEKLPPGGPAEYDQRSVYGGSVASKFWERKTNADGQLLGSQGWPCQKPPWGHLTAIDAQTGDIVWQSVLGITEELPPAKQKTGRINIGGSIATAGGLVFIGATNDNRFRAFDSKTGEELWVTKLDYSALSTPITFLGKNGKQYVAISAAGGMGITDPNPANSESLYVFALP